MIWLGHRITGAYVSEREYASIDRLQVPGGTTPRSVIVSGAQVLTTIRHGFRSPPLFRSAKSLFVTTRTVHCVCIDGRFLTTFAQLSQSVAVWQRPHRPHRPHGRPLSGSVPADGRFLALLNYSRDSIRTVRTVLTDGHYMPFVLHLAGLCTG